MTKRNYELMFVVSTELSDEEREDLLARVKRYLENADAEITSLKSWGQRQLAYRIAGHRDGTYYLAYFSADPEGISDIERNLHLTEDVLRHILVRFEGETLPRDSESQGEEANTG